MYLSKKKEVLEDKKYTKKKKKKKKKEKKEVHRTGTEVGFFKEIGAKSKDDELTIQSEKDKFGCNLNYKDLKKQKVKYI